MNTRRPKPDIAKVFADGHLIDEAIREGVHRALLEHKRAGNPIAVWRDGKVIMLQPEAIPV